MRCVFRFRALNTTSFSAILLSAGALLLPSCNWDGNFTVLGYTTRPLYPCDIRTVYVPIFKNNTYRRGIEFDLTRAVVREIEAKTPYKVVSTGSADTELSGAIISLNKNVINRNQLNEVREAETTLSVLVVWKDLRPGHTGEILSARQPPIISPSIPNIPPPAGTAENVLPDGSPVRPPEYVPPGVPIPPPPAPGPVLIQSVASFIPELGESITTAEKRNVDRLATQIVSMMESPW